MRTRSRLKRSHSAVIAPKSQIYFHRESSLIIGFIFFLLLGIYSVFSSRKVREIYRFLLSSVLKLHFFGRSLSFCGADEQEVIEDDGADDNENLPNISRDAVGKHLKGVKKGFNKEDDCYLRHFEAVARESISEDIEKKPMGTNYVKDTAHLESHGREAMECISDPETDDEGYGFDDSEWEDGSLHAFSSKRDFQEGFVNVISVEFDVSPVSAKGKNVRRATAEEKEVAELVHKAHLLCLLGRGRLIDNACNDPLIQASLLSLVPKHFLKEADTTKLTASFLSPIVSWIHKSFRVRSPSLDEKSFNLELASTLESQEGTAEVVAALSVALFRAMNLTTRFVSILDVVSLKPGADKSEHTLEPGSKIERIYLILQLQW